MRTISTRNAVPLLWLFLFVVHWTSAASFNLTILHTNDIHCRFDEANKNAGTCRQQDSDKGNCFGGYARLVHQARQIRNQHPNTIFLNAGDFFQGTIWYSIHKWKAVSHFGNMLNLTAMSLGNHEFDDGVDGLIPFVESANHPVLAANIDSSNEPRLDGKISKSIVVQVGGKSVGIIGYLTTETTYISSAGKVKIFDEVQGVRDEAERLKKSGVNILIAVGHAGYLKDMEIASKVPDIDVVVGGHTNTFLWNGPAPSIEEPQGPYPTMVKQPSGKSVPVVQAFAFGKYLGNLMVTFNDEGEVIAAAGLPILMDKSIPQDPSVLQELIPFRKEVEALSEKEVGKTRVFLDGNRLSCRMVECNLGNFLADAYVDLFTKFAGEGQWNKVAIALVNSGGIRASIDERAQNGSITYGDLLAVAPFSNTVDIIKISGETLKNIFEFTVHDYNPTALDPFGGFLQVAGVRVVYDISRSKGDRVTELLARCNNCRIPIYRPVQPEETYDIAVASFFAGGGDGFAIKGNIIEHTLTGSLDVDTIIGYMERISPITTGVEGRIRFTNETMACGKTKNNANSGSTNLSGFATFAVPISSLTALLLYCSLKQ
ncbi:snake venom 5'-nucleotidase-like [Daphnia pulicaria]|uniref:snake venom 5'-nucleotidase-like n=1 Tax=Daphnia pulicaria TaxID=35523 RepID=UPI001EEBFF94|nr:snake venom 5'-nucleotidase-like [Daphnia pulicaria]